jgi:hypothetical protein
VDQKGNQHAFIVIQYTRYSGTRVWIAEYSGHSLSKIGCGGCFVKGFSGGVHNFSTIITK